MSPLVGDNEQATGLPAFLTVEEAGDLLRIGRTKAYAMAREWRETDGQSGLPVIDLGHVLRVPRHALEEMVGVVLTDFAFDSRADGEAAGEKGEPVAASAKTASIRQPKPGRRNRIASQLDLFDTQIRAD